MELEKLPPPSSSDEAVEFKVPAFAKPTKIPSKPKIIPQSNELASIVEPPETSPEKPKENNENSTDPSKNEPKPVADRQLQGLPPPPKDLSKYKAQLNQLKYNTPSLAAPFDTRYGLEVLKTGSIVDQVNFSNDKTYFVVGRIPGCDIVAENPTVSRIHAILQFWGGSECQKSEPNSENQGQANSSAESECKERGLYLFDLNSTHGTFLNKNQIYPRRYYRLRVGHMIKFGNSSRMYIVVGPSEDEETESDKGVTELLKERLAREFERKKLMESLQQEEKEKESEGISWGMGDDAEEETDLSVNPFAANFESTELDLDNPKKTLAGWFDREGYDLNYDVREKASGHFICRVILPLDGPGGTQIFAEVDAKGKKKDIVTQCALQACQILDKYGVLRQSHHEGFKRKTKDWEGKDYYSSDEDTFLDRTGSIEQKRKIRMKKHGKADEEKAESFESLNEKFKSLQDEIEKFEQKIIKAEIKNEKGDDDEVDPLEAFMQSVKSGVLDIKQMKTKLKQLKEEQNRIQKLIEIARPAGIPLAISAKIKDEKPIVKAEPPSTKIKNDPEKEITAQSHTSSSQLPTKRKQETETSEVKTEIEKASTSVPLLDQKESSKPPIAKKTKVLGPQRPEIKISVTMEDAKETAEIMNLGEDDNEDMEADNDHGEQDNSSKKKKKRHRLKKEEKYEYDVDNPDYAVWLPPTDQAGDGRTSLNDKLGY